MGIGFFIYVVILILFALLSIFYLEYAAIQVLIIAFVLPVLMLIILRILRRNLYIEIENRTPVVELEQVEGSGWIKLRIKVVNTSVLFPLLKGVVFVHYENKFTGEKGRARLTFSGDCKGEETKELQLRVHSVGKILLSIDKIKIYDYLSLFSTTMLRRKKADDILVLPALIQVCIDANRFVGEDGEESNRYSPYKKGEDPTEIFDIREYEDGDKIQRIHWKLSYKRQTLMVKDYSLPLANEVEIFVDLSMKKKGKERNLVAAKLVQGVYSIALAFLELDIPQQLIWFDEANLAIREETVTKEEDLFWVLQEMLSTTISDDAKRLPDAYVAWEESRKKESGIYLTVNEDCQVDGSILNVRQLSVIPLNEKSLDEINLGHDE